MLTANDIIDEATRLLVEPVDLGDYHPTDVETHEQYEAALDEERERRWQARLNAYLADRSDRLALLRHVYRAANDRATRYKQEAQAWERKAKGQLGLAEYCESLTRNVLVAERQLAGRSGAYRVELPNGTKMGLRVTKAVEADVTVLPTEYVRTRVTREPDKIAIREALESGAVVEGAHFVERESVDWGRG
jgi:hypothetical protein